PREAASAPIPAPTPAPARKSKRGAAANANQLTLFGAEPAASRAEHDPGGIDLQRIAAERVAERTFTVISGGPGTGKTSTVVSILALLCERALSLGLPPPRTLLLAPPGKAAARLSEAIRRAKAGLDCAPHVRRAISEDASTIHRALGAGRGGREFRHGRSSP